MFKISKWILALAIGVGAALFWIEDESANNFENQKRVTILEEFSHEFKTEYDLFDGSLIEYGFTIEKGIITSFHYDSTISDKYDNRDVQYYNQINNSDIVISTYKVNFFALNGSAYVTIINDNNYQLVITDYPTANSRIIEDFEDFTIMEINQLNVENYSGYYYLIESESIVHNSYKKDWEANNDIKLTYGGIYTYVHYKNLINYTIVGKKLVDIIVYYENSQSLYEFNYQNGPRLANYKNITKNLYSLIANSTYDVLFQGGK